MSGASVNPRGTPRLRAPCTARCSARCSGRCSATLTSPPGVGGAAAAQEEQPEGHSSQAPGAAVHASSTFLDRDPAALRHEEA